MPPRGTRSSRQGLSLPSDSQATRTSRQCSWHRRRTVRQGTSTTLSQHRPTPRLTTARREDAARSPSQSAYAHDDEVDDLDHLNEVIMAVEMRERDTVGCAYYRAQNEKLCFMEDAKMGNIDIVDQRK